MGIEIKNATRDMKDTITARCRETFEAHRAAAPSNWSSNHFDLFFVPMISQAFLDKNGRSLIESPNLFIAHMDDAFAGYYRLSHLPTDPKTEYFSVEIHDIYVVDQFQGRGVGAAMVDHAKNLAAKHDWDQLAADVADWNTKGRRLFESSGFSVISRKFGVAPDRAARDTPKPTRTKLFYFTVIMWLIAFCLALVIAYLLGAR